jgi:SAM-dependent methyltransferase
MMPTNLQRAARSAPMERPAATPAFLATRSVMSVPDVPATANDDRKIGSRDKCVTPSVKATNCMALRTFLSNQHDLTEVPTYSSYTYNSPNALKRVLHRNRYINILRHLKINWDSRIFDFGAGDGRLFRVMIDDYSADPNKLVAFDPVPAMRDEFVKLVPEAQIYGDCREIAAPSAGDEFHYIFCCEVFEHLTDPQIEIALAEFGRLAGLSTVFLVEVPIEIGPAGLLKNLYRRFKSGVDIPVALIVKALLGFDQKREPRRTPSGEETFEHPGYSFKATRKLLSRIMVISSEFNDPFRHAPFIVNNSRIFVGKLRP